MSASTDRTPYRYTMIERIYIDNYLCLSNFELRPAPLNLFLGDNGSGKSAVFEVMAGLADLLLQRRKLEEIFPHTSTTRWDTRDRQTFELDFVAADVSYHYKLVVEHPSLRDSATQGRTLISSEIVEIPGQGKLFVFEKGSVQLFHDDFNLAAEFPFTSETSFLALVEERPSNTKLMTFKQALGQIWSLAIVPWEMSARSEQEKEHPGLAGEDFSDWYRSVLQERPESLGRLFEDLKEAIPGFRELRLEKTSPESRILKVILSPNDRDDGYALRFDELSTGQRALIFYYTLLHMSRDERRIFLLDEPDNFLALPEIQPWLISFSDLIEEGDGQAFVISHNSEVLNYLTRTNAWLFERPDGGPTRVRAFEPDRESDISAAEQIARGWVDEP